MVHGYQTFIQLPKDKIQKQQRQNNLWYESSNESFFLKSIYKKIFQTFILY